MFLVIFKGICMKFSPELKKKVSHSLTSKKPLKILKILMGHPALLFEWENQKLKLKNWTWFRNYSVKQIQKFGYSVKAGTLK